MGTADADDAEVDTAAPTHSVAATALSEFFKAELLEGAALRPLLEVAAAAALRSTVDAATHSLAAAVEDCDSRLRCSLCGNSTLSIRQRSAALRKCYDFFSVVFVSA